MVNLIELHNDPAKMAEFMEWPFEADEVIEYGTGGNWPYNYQTQTRRKRTAEEATRERYGEYKRFLLFVYNKRWMCPEKLKLKPDVLWHNFIRECARVEFGIKGRTAEEVQRKCIEQHPERFCAPDGEFKMPPAVTAALPVKRMRGT